ncbi:hypothetical protein BZG36_03850 [Bifiguratus adelaidae]|uniref:Uncharacterized protein n=1 Tax=Bifiguratus adelaidae TaxID=1938954 RepID=A0A261XWE5_9FUNG|nr:hypothetical protein BZG36_03850 [Bifiguratus adelaidae]
MALFKRGSKKKDQPKGHSKMLEYVWLASNGLFLINALVFLVSWLVLHSFWHVYLVAYAFVAISYAISVFKEIGLPKEGEAWGKKFLMSESALYLMLAIYWMCSKPVAISLVPFIIYAVFHIAQFIEARKKIQPSTAPQVSGSTPRPIEDQKVNTGIRLPGIEPAPTSTTPPKQLTPTQAKSKSGASFRDKYYAGGMDGASKVEIFGVLPWTVLRALFLRSSMFTPLVFVHFLRLRYFTSSVTRHNFHATGAKIDQQLISPQRNPKIPKKIGHGWMKVKAALKRFAGRDVSDMPVASGSMDAPTNAGPTSATRATFEANGSRPKAA